MSLYCLEVLFIRFGLRCLVNNHLVILHVFVLFLFNFFHFFIIRGRIFAQRVGVVGFILLHNVSVNLSGLRVGLRVFLAALSTVGFKN